MSSYNIVMSINLFPPSTDSGQQTDQIQVGKVHHSTLNLSEPSLLFEASDRFFGVVYNDAEQDTSCSSSTRINVSTLESATDAKTSQSSHCTLQTAVNVQQCNDKQQGGAASHHSPNFDSDDCVKKSKHIFGDQNGHSGGIQGVSDNDDFNLWTSLGSSNKFQSWNTIPDSVTKLIHCYKDVLLFKTNILKTNKNGSCQNPH